MLSVDPLLDALGRFGPAPQIDSAPLSPAVVQQERTQLASKKAARGEALTVRVNDALPPQDTFVWEKTIRASQSNPCTRVTIRGQWHHFGDAPVPVAVKWMGAPHSHGGLKLQDISNEAYWLRQTEHLPGAPKLRYHDVAGQWIAADWLNGTSPTKQDLCRPHVRRWAMEALAHFHETPMPSDAPKQARHGLFAWDNENLINSVLDNKVMTSQQKEHLQALQALSSAIVAAMQRYPFEPKLVHSDAKPGNCMYDEHASRITFIDLEDAGPGDPMNDVSFFSLSMGADVQEALG